DVDLLDEHAGRVVRHPVRRLVVDRVPRRASEPDELHARAAVRPQKRDVLITETVDLRRAHHDVTRSAPHDVEHRAVGVPARDDLGRAFDADRHDVLDEECFAVGHHEVGFECRLREPATDHGDGADRVGEDLAVTAPGLRARDDADFGACEVSHRAATAFWYSSSVTSMYVARNASHASDVFALPAYSRWNASSRS